MSISVISPEHVGLGLSPADSWLLDRDECPLLSTLAFSSNLSMSPSTAIKEQQCFQPLDCFHSVTFLPTFIAHILHV